MVAMEIASMRGVVANVRTVKITCVIVGMGGETLALFVRSAGRAVLENRCSG